MDSSKSASDVFERTHIKIPSRTLEWSLDAWKYLPRTPGAGKSSPNGFPVIVMAHGLSANKLMGLEPYAKTFVSLGYAVVVFDYRRWGASAGIPRHVVYVSEQLDDYRTVVKFCRQQPEIDPNKVVIWGTSFSGGHVITLSSERELNLLGVVSQCPFLGLGPPMELSWTTVKILWKGIKDVLRQALGLYPTYIPAAAHPGEVGLLNTPGSKQGLAGLASDQKDFPNEVSASSLFELPFYNPNASGARITCPVLAVVAKYDNLCPMKAAFELKALSPNVELNILPCGHFELYPGRQMYDRSLEAMKTFVQKIVQSS
ncbi:alpha/beta-hydrolase [Trametes meyenii]|nr:alpha/beta-hydrolase [Trametes meyenii]